MMKACKFDIHLLILSALLLAVFFLIFPTVQDVEYRASHDEGYYLRYADFIANRGLSGLRDLFAGYISNQENWVFPNPLRIGFILLSSLWVKLLGSSYYSLSHLSFFSYLSFIAITYYFCRKFFGRDKAILFSLLTAFSPINMAMSKRALSESVNTFFLGLCIWLFLDIISENGGIFKKFFFLAAFMFTMLIKETNIILVIPFLLCIIVYKTQFGENIKPKDLFYFLVLPSLLAGMAYVILSGSVVNVLKVIGIILSSPQTNDFAVTYGSGPWYTYMIDYMLLSPWAMIFSIGYIFYLAQDFRKNDSKETYFLIILVTLFFIFNFFTKNIRYVMILDLPLRLFFILMLYRLIAIKSDKLKYALITLIVLAVCLTDFITYNQIFVAKGIYDPVSAWLLEARNLAGWK